MDTTTQKFVVVTGAAGFIGSVLAKTLWHQESSKLVLVDDFGIENKKENWRNLPFVQQIHREEFPEWLLKNGAEVAQCYHLGARTDTTEMDYAVHEKWNLNYTKEVWLACTQHKIPLVYASSAATYGDGALGYYDHHDLPQHLKPLNPYGISKNEFDIWALQQKQSPPFWAGLKFFNVYGPNEYHKGRMASVIFHAFQQIQNTQTVKLFRSHRADFNDGGQIRDFIYVKDIVSICIWLMKQQPNSGLFNAGTAQGRSFNNLVKAVFTSLQLPVQIDYIDTPLDIRNKYQYYTQAEMDKLHSAGYSHNFYTLEEGINEYVQQYLLKGSYF